MAGQAWSRVSQLVSLNWTWEHADFFKVANRGQLPRSPTSNTAGASNHNNNIQNNNSTASSMVTGGAYAPYGNNDYARPQQQLPRAKCEHPKNVTTAAQNLTCFSQTSNRARFTML